jgi:hypothetical protein
LGPVESKLEPASPIKPRTLNGPAPAPAARDSRGDVDFGAGAFDPLTAGLAAGLAGLAYARRRRQAR